VVDAAAGAALASVGGDGNFGLVMRRTRYV